MAKNHLGLQSVLLLITPQARRPAGPIRRFSLAVVPETSLLLVPLLHDGTVFAVRLVWKVQAELVAKIIPLLRVFVKFVVEQLLHFQTLPDNPHLVLLRILAWSNAARCCSALVVLGGQVGHGHGMQRQTKIGRAARLVLVVFGFCVLVCPML